MKKNGFTLAEILISLGIVGTIAAITLPSLMTNTTTAQIGPKLAKAVSVFEQANEALLNDSAVDKLSETGYTSTGNSYGNALCNYLKITNTGANTFLSKDGIKYSISANNTPSPVGRSAHAQRIGDITIDINGNSNPNTSATDIFYFSLWNDGSLRPKGSINWNGGVDNDMENCTASEIAANATYCNDDGKKAIGAKDRDGGSEHWKTKCAINSIPSATGAEYCAGHVFENNLKVRYK